MPSGALILIKSKDVMVVETDWPAVCSGTTMSESSVPISVAGQSTWVAGIRTALQGISGGHGIGIVYWEPSWIGNAGLGSSCAVSRCCLELCPCSNVGIFVSRTLCWLMARVTHVLVSPCSPLACKAPTLQYIHSNSISILAPIPEIVDVIC